MVFPQHHAQCSGFSLRPVGTALGAETLPKPENTDVPAQTAYITHVFVERILSPYPEIVLIK